MGNNGKLLSFADVHHFYFSHTANCLEEEYETRPPSRKPADNSDLSHPAMETIFLHSDPVQTHDI